MNWYGYCGGNPVGFVDPYGLYDNGTAREGKSKSNKGRRGFPGYENDPRWDSYEKKVGGIGGTKTMPTYQYDFWKQNNDSKVLSKDKDTVTVGITPDPPSEDDANREKAEADDAQAQTATPTTPKSPNDYGKTDDKPNSLPGNDTKNSFGKMREHLDRGIEYSAYLTIGLGIAEVIAGGLLVGGSGAGFTISGGSSAALSYAGVTAGGMLIRGGMLQVISGIAVLSMKNGEGGRNLEKTPNNNKKLFEKVKGSKALKNKETGEIWEKDLFHKNHYEVYKNKRDWENGIRSRSVWEDGRIKDVF